MIRDGLLVTAPVNAITPAVRDRMAEQREELLLLVEGAGPPGLVPVESGTAPGRQPLHPVLAAHFAAYPPEKRYEITGVQTAHGAAIVTFTARATSKDPRGVFTYTGDLLVPGDKYDAAELLEVLQQVIDTPIH